MLLMGVVPIHCVLYSSCIIQVHIGQLPPLIVVYVTHTCVHHDAEERKREKEREKIEREKDKIERENKKIERENREKIR